MVSNNKAARRFYLMGWVLLLALAPFASSSWAVAADASDDSASNGNQLEEIVVTATKRAEDIQHVPVSVFALSGNDLTLAGAKSMDDFAALSPGVEFDNQSGYGTSTLTFLSIRGITSAIGASTTGVYIGETPIQGRINDFSNFGNPFPFYFDLDRVEVLRGPQGTLFGAGAEGGAIRFIFNQPSLTTYSGTASAEVAQIENGGINYESGVAAGGPIVQDQLGFRASAWYRRDGGYIDTVDPFTGARVDANANRDEEKAVRLAFLAAFDGVTIEPSFYYQSKAIHDATGFYGYLSNTSDGDFNDGHIVFMPADDHYYLAALNIQANLGAAKLTSVSSYFSRSASTIDDSTGTVGSLGATAGLPLGNAGYGNPLGPAYPVSYADAAAEPNSTSQHVITEELRLASPDASTSRLTWVAGLFFSRSTQDELTNFYDPFDATAIGLPPNISLLYLATEAIDTQYALFGQADYALTPRLKLTAGVSSRTPNIPLPRSRAESSTRALHRTASLPRTRIRLRRRSRCHSRRTSAISTTSPSPRAIAWAVATARCRISAPRERRRPLLQTPCGVTRSARRTRSSTIVCRSTAASSTSTGGTFSNR